MSVEEAIGELYGTDPAAFTARRAELVAAARKRGDKAAATVIGAARRPTAAAWVVNVLVRSEGTAVARLAQLAELLRAAHSTMDGSRIRELSLAQRKLVDELARAGFAAAGMAQPSATMRDDVVGTLHAAIADSDVAARLGRLSKAERWSGFGDFGAVVAVGARGGRKATESEPEPAQPAAQEGSTEDELTAARDLVTAARAALTDTERRHAATVDELAERESRVATARRRYEKLLEKLSVAEQELSTADAERAAVEQAAGETSDLVQRAKAHLADAESDLADLEGST